MLDTNVCRSLCSDKSDIKTIAYEQDCEEDHENCRNHPWCDPAVAPDSSFCFQGKLAKLVKEEGNKMLNAQFDFRTLNISLLRNFPSASVSLEDFWLKGTGPFENDTLIQAGELTAAVNLFRFSVTADTISPGSL